MAVVMVVVDTVVDTEDVVVDTDDAVVDTEDVVVDVVDTAEESVHKVAVTNMVVVGKEDVARTHYTAAVVMV